MRVLVFPVVGERIAVPLAAAREVIEHPTLTLLPTAPTQVLGLYNLRGGIVPVFDTAALLSTGKMVNVEYAVVVTAGGHAGALAASGIPSTADLEDSTSDLDNATHGERYRLGEKWVLYVDPEVLLTTYEPGVWHP